MISQYLQTYDIKRHFRIFMFHARPPKTILLCILCSFQLIYYLSYILLECYQPSTFPPSFNKPCYIINISTQRNSAKQKCLICQQQAPASINIGAFLHPTSFIKIGNNAAVRKDVVSFYSHLFICALAQKRLH